jgi:predicted CXXCH cytochrome family protein
MSKRFERLIVALMFALLAAGATMIIASAQDANPPVVGAQGEGKEPCAGCHAEYQTTWQAGLHGQAGKDPIFVASWEEQGKPGACLVCHVTGYDPATATWTADGVTCDACHTTPEEHPKAPSSVDRSPDLCGRCHSDTRFGWQDWQGSTHYQRGMDCAVCHDPHSASLKHLPVAEGATDTTTDPSQLCINCHNEVSMEFPYSQHHEQGVSCVQCHVEHLEDQEREPHSMPDHSFQASLKTCNTCHSDQMHGPTSEASVPTIEGTTPVAETEAAPVVEPVPTEVTSEPAPVSPIGYAGLAGLVGLAAGMVLAPWLERFYHRVSKHHHEDENHE